MLNIQPQRETDNKNIDYLYKKIKENYHEIESDIYKANISEISVLGAYYKMFMCILGIDLEDDNSIETPYRIAKMYLNEICKGLNREEFKLTSFSNKKENGDYIYNQYIVIKDIPYYSLCSHHHLPFFGKVDIAYFPEEYFLGLSKFARIVDYLASKPQTQENLTNEIANFINEKIKPRGVMVRVRGRHLCMECRGAKVVETETITQQLIGDIDKNEVLHIFR